jgi:hypothetical protein
MRPNYEVDLIEIIDTAKELANALKINATAAEKISDILNKSLNMLCDIREDAKKTKINNNYIGKKNSYKNYKNEINIESYINNIKENIKCNDNKKESECNTAECNQNECCDTECNIKCNNNQCHDKNYNQFVTELNKSLILINDLLQEDNVKNAINTLLQTIKSMTYVVKNNTNNNENNEIV